MKLTDYKRVIAIGDIHGQFYKLMNLWEKIKYNDTEDCVIFLGDYIDRGGKSVECLKFVKTLTEHNKNVIALKGNHENFMDDYFLKHDLKDNMNDIWLDPNNGGRETLNQLKELSEDEVKELIKFVNQLKMYYDKFEGYFFVHAGIDPRLDIYRQSYMNYLWIREDFLDWYDGDRKFVVGHTPVQYYAQEEVPILLENNILMMDTGAAMGRKISAIDLISEKVWQSN